MCDVALGGDLSPDRHVEFHGLRLDQTGVELPGQAFDIDCLGTDGYDVTYVAEDQPYFDRLDAGRLVQPHAVRRQRPAAGQTAPVSVLRFHRLRRLSPTWIRCPPASGWRRRGASRECGQLTAGVDLRYLKQELNEITSGRIVFNIWTDANSPIPESDCVNPGLFVEYAAPLGDQLEDHRRGAASTWRMPDVLDGPCELASLGTASTPDAPISLADILGSDEFDQTYRLWAAVPDRAVRDQ